MRDAEELMKEALRAWHHAAKETKHNNLELEAIAVEYEGAPPFGVGGKDVILKTLADLGRNTVALERSVEYRGDAVRAFSTDTRFTIANMTAEFGGLNGIFEADEVVAAWLSDRRSDKDDALYFRADEDAPYVARYKIDLAKLGPLVAKPFSPDNVMEVEKAAGMALHGCFIGACTTTDPAPTLALRPRVMFPRTAAPAPTTTPASSVGWRFPFSLPVPPRVTPWYSRQSSPTIAVSPMTVPMP